MAKKSTSKKTEDSPEPTVVETKEQKLIRLANKRVANACAKISLIGNLGAYKPTDEQVTKIMTALGESCARVQNRLEGSRKESIRVNVL